MKKIISTGGDTTGYVAPNLALFPSLEEASYEIRYIGSYQDMKRKLIGTADTPYDGMSSGKLRRHSDIKNFSDPFRVAKGRAETRQLLKRYKPDVIFSKGGFVAVPAVLTAKHYKISVIIHESDMTFGLANKICILPALKVCCNFLGTLKYLPLDKTVLTGSPIRAELLQGDRLPGLSYAHLSVGRSVLLVTGGGLGSVTVNMAVRNILPRLLSNYQVMHTCGKGNLDESLIGAAGYVQYEYVDTSLKYLFAVVDLAISRAGANSICELLALRKPNLFIPPSAATSHGDQILNANPFTKQGFSKVLEEEASSDDSLFDTINNLYLNRNSYIQAMKQSNLNNAVKTVVSPIELCAK